MIIYRTKFGQIIDENNIEVSEQIFTEYLTNNGTIENTDFVFESDLLKEDLANATEVSAINFLVQLELEGVTEDNILAIIDTLPEPNRTIARVSFKRATFFERENPLLTLVGQAYGFDSNKLDEIFINANKLPI